MNTPETFTINCKGRLINTDLLIMGIVNITTDSFYQGSRFTQIDLILKQVERMMAEGADIIDLGAQSTRPGASQLSFNEESDRILPVIKQIHERFPEVILSVDTFYAAVAKAVVEMGASMINDISGGSQDVDMLPTIASLQVPYVCMHMRGDPRTMQQLAVYDNVSLEVLDYFVQRKSECIKAGIRDIIIDPGFGFAKKIEHNLRLLKQLEVFKILGLPILTGLSRKSTIYKTLQITPEEALNGSTVLQTIAIMNGANILRVHDVKEAKEIVTLIKSLRSA